MPQGECMMSLRAFACPFAPSPLSLSLYGSKEVNVIVCVNRQSDVTEPAVCVGVWVLLML
jgi:hypothetical protein